MPSTRRMLHGRSADSFAPLNRMAIREAVNILRQEGATFTGTLAFAADDARAPGLRIHVYDVRRWGGNH